MSFKNIEGIYLPIVYWW